MIQRATRRLVRPRSRAYSLSSQLLKDKPAESLELLNVQSEDSSPEEVVEWAMRAGNVAMMSSFGIQASVLLHLATQAKSDIPVIMVDTGFLPKETYDYAETLTKLLGLNLTVVSPEISTARMEAAYGPKLWETNHKMYGQLTKVEPMQRGIASLSPSSQIMLSGLRANQTESRKNMKQFTTQKDGRLRVLPMLRMSDADVDAYMERHGLPSHPLASKGYVTVGDWHSSRPLQEGEDARTTRFGGRFQECGLHVTDDAEVDAMIGRQAHAAMREARLSLTREKSMNILDSTEKKAATDQGSCLVTHFVKKRLDNGDMCGKCNDVSAKLKKDGLEDMISGISIAESADASSDGAVLAKEFEQEKAPFFLVKDQCSISGETEWKPIYAYGKWKKLAKQSAAL